MEQELYDDESMGYNIHGFSKEEIYGYDQLKIYQHYEPTLHMGMQKNPLYDDIRASLSLYEREGKVLWKDHGNGYFGGDIFAFVQHWYKKNRERTLGFREIIKTIHFDMKLEAGFTVNPALFFHDDDTGHILQRAREKSLVQVKDIGWTDWALAYWEERYNICPAILEEYNVGHAKEVWVTRPGKRTYLWGVSTRYSPIYYFYFPLSENIKCYAPMARGMKKWVGNANNITDVQGYHQLHIKQRRPEVIIFTKAMKEVMFYRSLGIDAIAGHGENHHFADDFIRHIKAYSGYQFSLYDNDWPGRKGALLLRNMHGIPIALTKEAKNITDLWEKKPKLIQKYAESFVTFKSSL